MLKRHSIQNPPPDVDSPNKLRIIDKQSISGNQAACQIKEPLMSSYPMINYSRIGKDTPLRALTCLQ